MKIALLIILTLSYKQSIAGLGTSKNKVKVDYNIKESTNDVNVEEVKGEHMVKHIFTAKDDKRITKVRDGKDRVAEASKKDYFSSVEVFRSNNEDKIYLIKMCKKTSSEDVIKYMYKFTYLWRIVIVDFAEYVISKLERGEEIGKNIAAEYKEHKKKLEEAAVENKTSISNEDGKSEASVGTVEQTEGTTVKTKRSAAKDTG